MKKTQPPTHAEWMGVLAMRAAAARSDGGRSLQHLLEIAKFNERPHLSLLKHAA